MRPLVTLFLLTTPYTTHSYTRAQTHTHTQTSTFSPLSLSSFPWHTCQGPRWPLTPPHLALLLIFPSDPLNLGWRGVRTGELVAIVRYNGGDAEDEGVRSMRTDGWACSSRNNSQPWRKSKGLEARWVRAADGGKRGETGEAGGREGGSCLLSCHVSDALCIYWCFM